ncbi:hypothetical protein GH714_017247 [Hevea brasiliensis]|uniref:NB-ARC domain-containing protein n=1 Tax=Hevea brasiliensis TaxID=3981 RepID=A0A6A6NDB4_HEVBR|nr:hypothetical protein GH714_017247 [Hevea brasiliensis]
MKPGSLIASAAINFGLALIVLSLFSIFKKRPSNAPIYYARRLSKRHHIPFDHSFTFSRFIPSVSWIPRAFRVTEDEILQIGGLDALIIIRLFKFGLWVHFTCLCFVSFYGLYLLYKEYDAILVKRIQRLRDLRHRPDQFTVLVRQIPLCLEHKGYDCSVDHFFSKYYPKSYHSHQMLYDGKEIENRLKQAKCVTKKIEELRGRSTVKKHGKECLLNDSTTGEDFLKITLLEEKVQENFHEIRQELPVAFATFKSRCGAALAAQSQQNSHPLIMITEMAPEPKDVSWRSLAIPLKFMPLYKIGIIVLASLLTIFFAVPVTAVQGIAKFEKLKKWFPPAMAIELIGAASLFQFLSIWSLLDEIGEYVSHPKNYPSHLASAVSAQADFFMTYILTDGLSGFSLEILQPALFLWDSIVLHTCGRGKDENPYLYSLPYYRIIPSVSLSILIGMVYAVVSPFLLPLLVGYFCLGYIVYVNQIEDVYETVYETCGRYWPYIHHYIFIAIILMQITMIGLFGLKSKPAASIATFPLLLMTIAFNEYCKIRFLPTFCHYSIQRRSRLDELKDAVYEADVLLDEIAFKALRLGVEAGSDDKEAIIKLLLSSDANGSNLGVIPIVCMGGVGKTTLAQLVYSDSRVQERFDLEAWVCVSEDFDVFKVTKDILKEVSKCIAKEVTELSCDDKTPNLLQLELGMTLMGRKVLIVLDDVWNDKYDSWDILMRPLKSAAQGSKIVFTTPNVASVMRTVATHHLKELTDDDCWSLFAKFSFDDGNSKVHSDLEVIGGDIVKKCKGLPLAAKTHGDSGSSIAELVELQCPQGALCIQNLQNIVYGEDASEANLNYKKHLKRLELRWTGENENSEHEKSVLLQLEPHTNVECLLMLVMGCKIPRLGRNEGGAFPLLQKRYVSECPVLITALPSNLPSLTTLEISRCPQLLVSLPRTSAILKAQLKYDLRGFLLEILPFGLYSLKADGFGFLDVLIEE